METIFRPDLSLESWDSGVRGLFKCPYPPQDFRETADGTNECYGVCGDSFDQ